MLKNSFIGKGLSFVLPVMMAGGLFVGSVPFQRAEAKTASSFTDVKKEDYFYDPVTSLADRQIIKGYSDHTFHPYSEVTRGQGAKILALSLGLNIENVKDPQFKDVTEDNGFYKYIAALANKHIISGSNGYFKPNNPLTRAQMAKIIAIGYSLNNGPLKDNPFKDVKSNDWYAEFITPLLEENITTGTTPTTFSPERYVTRGQMAAFVYRAENAINQSEQITSSFIGFDGNDLVLQSGKYQLSEEDAKWLNTVNEEVLKGSELHFTAKQNEITGVKEVVLNPSSPAILKGQNAVFNGNLVIRGSLNLENLTINGDLNVSENDSLSFSGNHLVVKGTTSIGFEDSNTFKKENSPLFRAAGIANPTVFLENSTFGQMELNQRNLNLTTNGTKLGNLTIYKDANVDSPSNDAFPFVTVKGSAANVTFNTDITDLTISTDSELTISGNGNLENVQVENSQKTIFQTNGTISTLGITDNKVKLQLDPTTKVTSISLPDGKAIDEVIDNYDDVKENIENVNGKVIDEAPPVNSGEFFKEEPIISSKKSGSIDVEFTPAVDGSFYIYFFKEKEGLSADEIIKAEDSRDFPFFYSNGNDLGIHTNDLKANERKLVNSYDFSQYPLDATIDYDVYVIVRDNNGNYSEAFEADNVDVLSGTKDVEVSTLAELKDAIYDTNVKDIYLKNQMVFSQDQEIFNGRGKTLISDTGSSEAPILVTGKSVSLREFTLVGSEAGGDGWNEKDNGIQYDEESPENIPSLIDVDIEQP